MIENGVGAYNLEKSGATILDANELNRNYIFFELNNNYFNIAQKRLKK